jgi:imidazolonepropionase-like amidohydrolase
MVVDGGPVLRQVFRNYEDSITWGVTTVRDLGGAPKFLKRHRVAIDQRVLAGPHILSSIGFLAVPGGYPDFLAGFPKIAQAAVGAPVLYATSPEQARDHVKRYYDEGADVIKIAFDHKSIGIHHNALNVLSDAQIEAIKDEAGLKGLPVAAHHQYTEGFETGLRHNIDSMEHVVTVSKLSDQQILRAADSKIPFIPTLTSRLNLAFKSENDAYSSDPGLNKRLQFRKEKMFPDIPNHCSRRIATLCERYIEHYQTGQYVDPKFKRGMALDPSFFTRGMVLGTQNLSRMIEAGVVIGVGNDSGVPLTFPGMLHFEMELLVGAGMTPAQVLRAATAVNAKICNVSKQCGTIEKGKRADLVLLEKNPIEDIANVAKVRAVFKNGRIVSKVPTFKYRYLPPKRS